MIVSASRLYQAAYERFALGAYSVNNLEQLRAAFQGSIQSDAPFILATSQTARRYARPRLLEALIRAADEEFSETVLVVHLDHGDEETCYAAIGSGVYSSVMIDVSYLPFEENIAVTRRVVERAHDRGVSVEAELGTLSGKEEDVQEAEQPARLTDPKQAAAFVERTGCDSLAVSVGIRHGVHKFRQGQTLDVDRLRAIHNHVPGVPLVLHGGSAVPAEEVRRINRAGGALDTDARGMGAEEYRRAVSLGVTKVNVDTDSRLVWTRVHREHFQAHPGELDFRRPGRQFVREYAALVGHRNQELGSAGQVPFVRRKLAP